MRLHLTVVKHVASEPDCLGANAGSTTYWLYDLENVNKPLSASVSPSV